MDEAKPYVAETLRLNPSFTIKGFREHAEDIPKRTEGLPKAGFAENERSWPNLSALFDGRCKAKSISRSQRNDRFGADSAPSKGDPWRGAIRPLATVTVATRDVR
jgi:hypothetical protein